VGRGGSEVREHHFFGHGIKYTKTKIVCTFGRDFGPPKSASVKLLLFRECHILFLSLSLYLVLVLAQLKAIKTVTVYKTGRKTLETNALHISVVQTQLKLAKK